MEAKVLKLVKLTCIQVHWDGEWWWNSVLCIVVFLVVIVLYKYFIVQYKSEDFRAVAAAAVKVPTGFCLLARHHYIHPLLAP